ncbi:TlpA family protein disulfide reductase [Solitalea lacus]|uniref:TlpA family protein disulfide reductase n=1 Tax=Solitalea lacus TaxID=2911172 RepID=UPI001EDC06C2|nr:TlpA disulfide reductase family protein [Solitalea lacus]UKJ06964.1 TlpA family protein disulfide reductase [Solitalea lacus]
MIKKILGMLSFCLCTIMTFAQKNEVKVVLDIAPIKADSMWANPEGGDIVFAKANKAGKYVFTFKVDKVLPVRVGIDQPKKAQLFLFLEENDQLSIKTDFEKKTSISGRGAENNKVLYDYMSVYIETYNKLDAKGMSPQEYYDMGNKLDQTSIDMLEANKQKVTPGFYNYQSVALAYQKLGQYIMLPYYYHLGFGKKLSEIIPADFWALDSQVKMDEQLLSNNTYKGFMRGNYPIYMRWRELFKQGKLDSSFSREQNKQLEYRLIEKYYTGKIRSMALTSAIKGAIEVAKDIATVKPLMDEYLAKYAGAEEAKEIKKTYETRINLSAGKVPPFFTLKDLAGKDVTLKDFAGKVVYMDFWASWCTPCRFEMKNGSPKLHEKFKDNKDVVFLYISIDSKTEPWKKAIADDKIEGIHLLSLGGNNSPVAKAFGISGVPRYIIIGKDGKIFDNDAPRPSQDITPAKIKEALNAK